MKRAILVLVTIPALVAASSDAAQAQRGRGGFGGRSGGFGQGGFGQRGFAGRGGFGRQGGLGLLGRETVQDELKLTDEQKAKVEELSEQLQQQQREMFQNFGDLSEEEQQALRDRMEEQRKQAVAEVLEESQRTRLAQIELQQQGAPALAKEELAAELGLSDEQKQEIAKFIQEATDQAGALREEMRGAFSGGFGGGGFDRDAFRQRAEQMRTRTEEINRTRDQRILAVLSDQQREAWTTKLGEAFELQEQRGFGNVGRRGGPGRRSRPGGDGGPAAQAAGVAATGDSGAGAADAQAQSGEKKIRFSFRYHPWSDVLDWFAEQADLSLHADNKPTGTCNYTDPTAYTPTDALDRLNELLITKGFILIRKDQTLFCWELVNPIPPSLVPEVAIADLDERGENEMVSVKLFLEKLVAKETGEHIEALKGPFGKVVALPSANLLVITDTAGNVRRMRDVLMGVDQSNEDGALRVFQLRFAQAKDVAAQVRQLLGLPAEPEETSTSGDSRSRRFSFGRESFQRQMFEAQRQAMQRQGRGGTAVAAAATPQASVVADTRTNRVLVAAAPNQLALAEQAIETLDTPQGAGDPQLAPQLEVYRVTRNDPLSVVTFLKEFLGEDSMVRLSYDLRSSSVYALASMSQQVTIGNLIDQMEGGGTALGAQNGRRTFQVGGADAEQLAEMIRLLWQRSGGDNPIILAPARTLMPRNGSRLMSPQSLRINRQRQNEAQTSFVLPRGEQQPARPEDSTAPVNAPREPDKDKPKRPDVPSTGEAARLQHDFPQAGEVVLTSHARNQDESLAFAQPSQTEGQAQSQQPAGSEQTASRQDEPAESAQKQAPQAPVIIKLENGVLTVESEDKEALQRIERIISVLLPSEEQAPFYVAPLYEAEATLVARTIEQVLSGVSSDLSSQDLITIGGSMRIIPDTRTNSLLIVGANPTERVTIEQLIQVLDTSDLPENALSRQPQLIPVKNTSAVEVAEVVRDVFSDYLNGTAQNGAQQNTQDPRAAFFARFGGRGGGSRNASNTQRTTMGRMTLGVDDRTNTIVVSAPSALLEQVQELVQQLDAAAMTTNRSIRVVPVALSNVAGTQQTLSLLFGGSSSSQNNSRSRGTPTGGRPSGFQGGFPGGFPGGFQPNFGNRGDRGGFRGGFRGNGDSGRDFSSRRGGFGGGDNTSRRSGGFRGGDSSRRGGRGR